MIATLLSEEYKESNMILQGEGARCDRIDFEQSMVVATLSTYGYWELNQRSGLWLNRKPTINSSDVWHSVFGTDVARRQYDTICLDAH